MPREDRAAADGALSARRQVPHRCRWRLWNVALQRPVIDFSANLSYVSNNGTLYLL